MMTPAEHALNVNLQLVELPLLTRDRVLLCELRTTDPRGVRLPGFRFYGEFPVDPQPRRKGLQRLIGSRMPRPFRTTDGQNDFLLAPQLPIDRRSPLELRSHRRQPIVDNPTGCRAGPASLAGPPPATDVIQLSNQSAPADRPLADVVRRRTVETVKRAELPAPSREPESAGTNRATIAGTVLRQTGGEASPDARTPDRRSEDDRPTGSAEWMPRRRAAEQPTPAEQPTFESRPIPGQASLAAQPVRGEARQPADSPALAAPNPFDRIVRRVDHLTLDLKDDAGDFGRLRVSVSGPLVRATIMPTDPAMADRLNQEIRQLKMTLEQRGFPEPRLTVQAPKPIDPVSWVPVTRDVVVDTGPTAQANTQRRGGDDDRRERWTENRDQRRDEQRQQEQARKPRQDQQGDPK